MARDINLTITNYNPGSGPASASVDISATWTKDDGTLGSASRTGVTLTQLWSRPLITTVVKQEVIQELIWRLVRIDAGIDVIS